MLKIFLTCFVSLTITTGLFAATSKEVKQLKKQYSVYDKGKIYAKFDTIALMGANIRFRVAAKQSDETSWKKKKYAKFSAIAKLDGIDNAVFQEITDTYQAMLIERFEKLGLTVIPYSEIEAAKSYPALKKKGEKDTFNSIKNWGVSKVFTPADQPYIVYNAAAPFGPHAKIVKELNAIVYNSLVNVDFCQIGIKITQRSATNHYSGFSTEVIYTEGKSSIVPAVNIVGHSSSMSLRKRYEDNTYVMAIAPKGQFNLQLDFNQSNIESLHNYATSTDRCDDCSLGFKSASFFKESNLDLVVVTASPEEYKKAVLDALEQYLDDLFTLYGTHQG